MCIIWRDVEKLRWKCYTRHAVMDSWMTTENVFVSMNLISIKRRHLRTEIQCECIMKWKSEALQLISQQGESEWERESAPEFLVYLLFAANLSHSRCMSLSWWLVSYFDDVISRHLLFLCFYLLFFFPPRLFLLSLSSADVIWNSNNFSEVVNFVSASLLR